MVNSHEAATAEFTRNPDAQVPGQAMREALLEAVGEAKTHFVDATRLATRLLGGQHRHQLVHARLRLPGCRLCRPLPCPGGASAGENKALTRAVARLYSDGTFRQQLEAQFQGVYRLAFHLAPPWLARSDPLTDEPRKRRFGLWMLKVFSVLALFKFLRGGPFDPFGYSAERKLERALVAAYEAAIESSLKALNADNYATAVAVTELPERIRGYGPVKERAVARAGEQARQLSSGDAQVPHLFDPAA